MYYFDLHTHTLASGHAYSTIKEMAKAASEKGLSVLGITEHSMNMPGTCHGFYFQNLVVVPRMQYGVRLLMGTEVNIIDYKGNLDMPEELLKNMDVVIASLHTPCIRPGSRQENTSALLGVMENPYVHIIGHPDDGRYPLDYEAVIKGAKEHHKLIEFNNNSLNPKGIRVNALENDRKILELCMRYEVPIILDSDAHVDADVANFKNLIPILEEVHFPEQLVVNRSVEQLKLFVPFS